MRNRSAPPAAVAPVLVYADVAEAAAWLCRVFGFVEHVRIADHRAQLGFGEGALIVADATHGRRAPDAAADVTHAVLVRVESVDAHHAKAKSGGAEIVNPPADMAFGERQYSAKDLAGHHWTFTEGIADVAPEDWGGDTVTPW